MFLLMDKNNNLFILENKEEINRYKNYKKVFRLCEYKTKKEYITDLKILLKTLINEKKFLKKIYKKTINTKKKSVIQSLIDNRKNNLKKINILLNEKNINNIKSYLNFKDFTIKKIPKEIMKKF